MVRQDQEMRKKRERKNVINKPSTKRFFENEKMRNFNKLFLQNLNSVKYQCDLDELISTSGLLFTQVKVSVDWNEVLVLWKANNPAADIGSVSIIVIHLKI